MLPNLNYKIQKNGGIMEGFLNVFAPFKIHNLKYHDTQENYRVR